VVEGRRRPRHQKPAGGCPEGDQPRSKAHTGSLPDGQPRSPQPGIGTQASAGTTLLDNRLRCFALRLASLPGATKPGNSSEPPDSMLGQRLQSFLGCWNGREETVLLEVAFPPEATTAIEEARSTTFGPTGADHLHRRLPPGEWRNWLRGRLEEGRYLERPQNPHGLGSGSLRRRMRSNCKGPPSSGIQKPCA